MKRIYILFIIIVLINLKTGFSQDSQFSQFYASPLYLAPSFAGSTDGDRFSLNYRNQWPAITKSFQTYSLGYDHYFPHLKSGIGLLLFREQAGTSVFPQRILVWHILINSGSEVVGELALV